MQDELGLNMYDYGARMYFPDAPRWAQMDPHAENYYSVSPYVPFANNPVSFIDPTGEDILFWQYNEKDQKWNQVAFNKLGKNIQKGIEAFGKTKAGYDFLSNFANKGDKIGSLSFNKDGKYSQHDMYFKETEGKSNYEGETKVPDIGRDRITFMMDINKDMENPGINIAETLGHETFLHLMNGLEELISAYKRAGVKGGMDYNRKDFETNPRGYKDHLSLKDDKQGRAKTYFEYISQLKSVLNPVEVQKQVNKEIPRNYEVGKRDKKRG